MKNLLIKPNSNIKDFLKQLSKVGEKCLVVVDKANRLLGTLSDGDVRKAILKGKYPNDTINGLYQKKPTFLKNEKNIDPYRNIDLWVPQLTRDII